MSKYFHRFCIAIFVFAAAALIFAVPYVQLASAEDIPKTEKAGKTGSSAETKMMNKQEKTPKVKTMGNGADKAKVKTGAEAKGGDDVTLKKGGKATAPAK